MSVRYWHGGMPGLRVGDLIEPGHERATRDDCPICDARRVGDRPAYFAGICWKRLRAMQEIAQQIVDGEG